MNNTENYVNGIFSRSTTELSKVFGSKNNTRGSILHDTQVEYCYLVKNITAGPDYIAPKFVSKVESLIEKINDFVNSKRDTRLPEVFEYPVTGFSYFWDGSTYRRINK
jgi:hypothetical protein